MSVERSAVRPADTCAAPGAVYVLIESSWDLLAHTVLAKHPNLDVYTSDYEPRKTDHGTYEIDNISVSSAYRFARSSSVDHPV